MNKRRHRDLFVICFSLNDSFRPETLQQGCARDVVLEFVEQAAGGEFGIKFHN